VMFAVESFKKFRWIDIFAILFLAGLWLLLSFLVDYFCDLQTEYIFSLLIISVLLAFTVQLVNKTGTAVIFFGAGSFFTSFLDNIGPVGSDKVLVFLIAAVVFELIFLVLKLEIRNLQFDIILGTALSAAVIPFASALIISTSVALTMLSSLINLVLLSFFIGLIGALIAAFIWYELRATRFFLRYFLR